MASFNPAGSSTPAGDTMRVPRSVSGGRTRNVINIVDPGGTGTAAYTATANVNSPSAATDGYANFHRQRYLHLQLKTDGFETDGSMAVVYLWLYNSMSERWSLLQLPSGLDDDGEARYFDWKVEFKAADGEGANYDRYYIIDIKGAERVGLEVGGYSMQSSDAGKIYAWMGVNSF